MYKNVLNKDESETPKKYWETLLTNLGQIKKTFRKAAEEESYLDRKLLKQLLSKKDFESYKEKKFEL